MQDRFHALLKRRLRTEIEQNPPLFPWEVDVNDYESEHPDVAIAEQVPAQFWLNHVQQQLPVPMSRSVLAQLLMQCQELAQSSLQQGVKLVRAVESLFPGETQTLNYLAGLVLASPSRSAMLSPGAKTDETGFPKHYDAATPLQQMALSLMAAREIVETLTLSVLPNQPRTKRHWLTDAGAVTLVANYQAGQSPRLRIEGHLPCAGTLTFRGQEGQAIAQRTSAGELSVELCDIETEGLYPLEIQLMDQGHPPLTFVVQVAAGPDQ
ncbi:MAG: PatU [Elainellaceae cyanobacterium]